MSFSTPVFRPGLYNPYPFSDFASIKLCHQWLRLERQHKDFLLSISNSHFNLFFSFFTWNWNDKYVCTLRSSCENHNRFQTKIGKLYIRFPTQTAQKLHGHCPNSLNLLIVRYVFHYTSHYDIFLWFLIDYASLRSLPRRRTPKTVCVGG